MLSARIAMLSTREDALAGVRAGPARGQPIDRAPRDGGGGNRDQRDLEQRGQRLGLAVAEAMIGIRRRGRHAHAPQGDERGDQIEPGIGERAEHRDRSGLRGGIPLEREQEQRGDDAGERGMAGERGAIAHG
jgi:hypothetical protein